MNILVACTLVLLVFHLSANTCDALSSLGYGYPGYFNRYGYSNNGLPIGISYPFYSHGVYAGPSSQANSFGYGSYGLGYEGLGLGYGSGYEFGPYDHQPMYFSKTNIANGYPNIESSNYLSYAVNYFPHGSRFGNYGPGYGQGPTALSLAAYGLGHRDYGQGYSPVLGSYDLGYGHSTGFGSRDLYGEVPSVYGPGFQIYTPGYGFNRGLGYGGYTPVFGGYGYSRF